MLELLFIAAFLVGALSKLTDVQTDLKVYFFNRAQYVTGAIYGILSGLLLSFDPRFSAVFFGVLAGVLITGKIDRRAHQVAVAGVILTVAYFGLPSGISFPLVLLFTAFASLDEFINDFVDRQGKDGRHPNFALEFIGTNRLSLEISTIAVGIISGQWIYLAAIVAFDIGYLLIGKLFSPAKVGQIGSLGNHLAIDLFDCSVSKLEDEAWVKLFLVNAAKETGMKMLTKPVVKRVSQPSDEGLSGFVVIGESHISLHTFPRIHSVNIDLFSCRDFEAQRLTDFSAKWFKAGRIRTHLLKRGEVF